MQKSPLTIKYTMLLVREIEKETGQPVSLYKRIEIQNMLLQWYFSITRKYRKVK